ncbi:MAG: signal peptidase II [Fusobacteriaceae bacterium]
MYYLIMIGSLLFLDQITKYLTVENFYYGETLSVFEGFFHLTYVKNMGIAFGMFQESTRIIAILTVIAVLGITFYMMKELKKAPKLEKIAYAIILAGALGNMIDRITRGFVVDMIDFKFIWTYVFNLADVWINIGVFLLLVDYFIRRKQK